MTTPPDILMLPGSRGDVVNAVFCNELTDMEAIHAQHVNICILEREIGHLRNEVLALMSAGVNLKTNGTVNEILTQIGSKGGFKARYPLVYNDIKQLLRGFETVSKALFFRFSLSTVKSDMCRKFHTDMNDLRLLSTYAGAATIWLPDDAVNRTALLNIGADHSTAVHPKLEQHAKTGDVLLLKGAIYPKDGTKALIHRSPSIEESGEYRLLLRIDTNEFLTFS